MIRRLLALTVLFLTFGTAAVLADDCGNGKDHGKGTPTCGNNGGSNNGGAHNNVVVTNDNINNVNLHNTNTSNSSSTSTSSSNSNATATGGNATATGGNASASQSQTATGGNAVNGGQANSQSIQTNISQPHQTASAIAPEVTSTAPCRVAGSGGGQGPFFGFSFSGSKLDTECEKRATAIAFAQLGDTMSAVELLCSTKVAQANHITTCDALADAKKNGISVSPAHSPVQ